MHGYNYSVAKNLGGTRLYTQILDPSPNNIFKVATLSKIDKTLDTFVRKPGDYILYLKKNLSKGEIKLIHNVTPQMIQTTVPHIYIPLKFIDNNYLRRQKKMIRYFADNEDKIFTHKYVDIYNITIRKIKRDMVNYFNRYIYYLIVSIDESKDYKSFVGKVIELYTEKKRI